MTKKIDKAVKKAVAPQPPPAESQPPVPTVNGQPVNTDPRIPREATITITASELQILYGALDELPAKFSRALYAKISDQVQVQIDAALKAPPPK